MLHGPRVDGEPQRPDCRGGNHHRVRPCRAAGGAEADRAPRRDPQPVTLGADKGYDSADFATALRNRAVTRMWRSTPAAAARSTRAPPVTPAMRSPSASANASRRPLVGPRRWRACARCGTADCSKSIGNSLSRWPPTTSFACPNCSPRMSDDRDTCQTGCALLPAPIRPIATPARHRTPASSRKPRSRRNPVFFQHPASGAN